MPSGLRIISPSLISVLTTLVPGVHKHMHYGTLMQISFYAVLPFLIQIPVVRLLLANGRIFSEYLKYKVSLYMGILASCPSVCEVYVVEQILPFNKDLPHNTSSSKQHMLNTF